MNVFELVDEHYKMQQGGTWEKQKAKVQKEKYQGNNLLEMLQEDKDLIERLSKKDRIKKETNTKTSDNTKVNTKNKPELISKSARNKTDKEIAEERKAKIEESVKYQDVPFTQDNWREVLAKETQSTGDKFRVSLEPNFFDDYLNPAVMVGGMASNLGQAPLQAQQQDSYMPYVTSVGMPLAVGAMAGYGTQGNTQFVNNLVNPLAGTGDVIDKLGNKYLPNAYKLNPNAFKPNPESYYRMIGDEGLADLQNVGYVRSNPNTFYADKNPFFSKGYPIDGRIGKSVVEDSKYLGNNMIEVGGNNEIGNRFVKNRWADAAPDPNIFVARDKIGINNPNLKVYEKDWLQGYKQVEVPKPTSNFKSEINWGNWNKEIPENTQLMKEYNAIEQTAKANGSWMKNTDGSPFQGTPEQFVQQNSSNFKKAFPEGSENVFRGTGENIAELRPNRSTFTANQELASGYAPFNKKSNFLNSESVEGGVHSFYRKNSKNSLELDANNTSWTSVDLSNRRLTKDYFERNIKSQEDQITKQKEYLSKMKQNPNGSWEAPDGTTYSNDLYKNTVAERELYLKDLKERYKNIDNLISNPKELEEMRKVLGNTSTTDDIATYVEKRNLDYVKLKNIEDSGVGDVTIVNHKPGNYLKSAVGNNGMFDMTNPNIYKSITPIAGATYLATQGQEEPKKFQQGGKFTENEKKFLEEVSRLKLI